MIYKDNSNEITTFFVAEYDLVQALWSQRKDFDSYVMNILANLALILSLKPYIGNNFNNIVVSINYGTPVSKIMLQLIYNWFYSQSFAIVTPKD